MFEKALVDFVSFCGIPWRFLGELFVRRRRYSSYLENVGPNSVNFTFYSTLGLGLGLGLGPAIPSRRILCEYNKWHFVCAYIMRVSRDWRLETGDWRLVTGDGSRSALECRIRELTRIRSYISLERSLYPLNFG